MWTLRPCFDMENFEFNHAVGILRCGFLCVISWTVFFNVSKVVESIENMLGKTLVRGDVSGKW